MKWLLATLNQLNRAYEFKFSHVSVNHMQIDEIAHELIEQLTRHHRLIAEDNSDEGDSDESPPPPPPTVSSVVALASPAPKNSSTESKAKPNIVDLMVDAIMSSIAEKDSSSSNNGPHMPSQNAEPPQHTAQQQQQHFSFKKKSWPQYTPTMSDSPPSDRSFETAIPRVLRERAIALQNELDNSNMFVKQTDPGVAKTAYEKRCISNDRDICNYLGAVMAVDFRHWISGSFGDDVSKLEGCWCRSRASSVLPCKCETAADTPSAADGSTKKKVFEPNVKQMYYKERFTGRVVRGSAAMISKMRDAVDVASESDPNKFWFRPAVMIRRLLQEEDGRFEIIDDLFSGCDITGTKPLEFAANGARVKLLTEVANFYKRTGKDFYDVLVESNRYLIGDRTLMAAAELADDLNHKNMSSASDGDGCGSSSGTAAVTAALNTIEFRDLPGLVPSLCRHMPRFYDCALFRRNVLSEQQQQEGKPNADDDAGLVSARDSSNDGSSTQHLQHKQPKFIVASKLKQLEQQALLSVPVIHKESVGLDDAGSPFRRRREAEDEANTGKDEVSVLFLKLAQLFAVSLRSARGLFLSGDLRWLRDNEPFLDEQSHLTICSDYQIPNALRNSGIIDYSAELQEDIAKRRLLPSLSLKEVEIRLVSVLAATGLREQVGEVIDKLLRKQEEQRENTEVGEKKRAGSSYRAFLLKVKETFTVSLLDYVIWLFGRSLTSAGLGHPHHLTPGIYY